MKYTIITKYTELQLIATVEEHIKNGWKPQGGICIYEKMGAKSYHQAMIKIEKKNPPRFKYVAPNGTVHYSREPIQ